MSILLGSIEGSSYEAHDKTIYVSGMATHQFMYARNHLPVSYRRVFMECPRKLREEERPIDAALFNAQLTPVALEDVCDFRYAVHIEALGVSPDLRHKLACGSIAVAFEPEYWEFWTRSLKPGRDYVQLTNEEDHICNQTAAAVAEMNTLFATVGSSALKGPKKETPTLKETWATINRNPDLSETLKRSRSDDDVPVPDDKGNYAWGSEVTPWEIAWAGYDFVHNNVRLEDAVLYTRDLLQAYARLQDFSVTPIHGSKCLNGPRLLQQIGGARSSLGRSLTAAHPWLASYEGNCQQSEKYWNDVRKQ